jgi:UPF0716 protein FxsA
MDPAPPIIYVAFAKDKAPALPIRLLPFLPLAWFVLEVIVLVEVGRAVGALAVVALLFVAAILGGLLLRHVGTSVVAGMLVRDAAGRPAIERLRSAGWQAAAGLLLILPGFASDVVALLLFLPPVRGLLASMLPKPAHVRTRSAVIEGEFQDLTGDPAPTGDPGGTRPQFPGRDGIQEDARRDGGIGKGGRPGGGIRTDGRPGGRSGKDGSGDEGDGPPGSGAAPEAPSGRPDQPPSDPDNPWSRRGGV